MTRLESNSRSTEHETGASTKDARGTLAGDGIAPPAASRPPDATTPDCKSK